MDVKGRTGTVASDHFADVSTMVKNGGKVLMDEEAEAYLNYRNADGATLDSKTILLRKGASRATVFEELIHTFQFGQGEIVDAIQDTIICEIKAKEKLLRNCDKYKLTSEEIEETTIQLEKYRDAYHLRRGENGQI